MKKFPIIRSFILILLLFFPVIPALPSETQIPAVWTVDDVLLRLKERERTLTTFVAGFKQIQQNSLFDQPQVSEGTLYFDHNSKLLMKMTTPEAYLVFITDRKMILGVPGSSSYRQKKLPGRNTFFKRVMGIGQSIDQLKNQYDIQMVATPCKETCELRLTPLKKSRRTPFTSIQATIDTLQWLPEIIHMEEIGGDVTTFYLQFTSINQPLPNRIFDIPLPDKKADRPEGYHDIK
ncbi:outer membrane lipoprotein carrier protein LolA [Thermodesulfobacteriota bacterium]